MKALVLHAYKNLALRDVPEPAVGADDVLVRVRACGICGSDVHGFDGSTGRRIPPLIMGHEAAGEIASVGARVTDWRVGDRVTFDSTIYCGACEHCRRGAVNLCDHREVIGVSCHEFRRHGAFAEFVAVPARVLYRLPPDLPYEKAAMTEAVSVAVHAVNRTPLTRSSAVAVIGTGMIGLLIVQVLRTRGCPTIIAVDVDAGRLERASQLGATHTIPASPAIDVPARVRELTGGHGADATLEVVGTTKTVQAAAFATRKGGAVTLVGNLSPTVEVPLQIIVNRELHLNGSCASCGEYPESLELIASGRVDVTAFMSATPPLTDGAAWFERLYAGEPGLMKVILRP